MKRQAPREEKPIITKLPKAFKAALDDLSMKEQRAFKYLVAEAINLLLEEFGEKTLEIPKRQWNKEGSGGRTQDSRDERD